MTLSALILGSSPFHSLVQVTDLQGTARPEPHLGNRRGDAGMFQVMGYHWTGKSH